MKPNILRVGRSAYYEHRATDKRYTERQRAELNLCPRETDPRQCDGTCEKVKAVRNRKQRSD